LVLSRLSEQLFVGLRVAALRDQVVVTRDRMKKSKLSPQLSTAGKDYFAALREMFRTANVGMLEIEQMVIGVQRRFAEDLGWSLSPPMAFSLDTYIADLERAEQAYKHQFGPAA